MTLVRKWDTSLWRIQFLSHPTIRKLLQPYYFPPERKKKEMRPLLINFLLWILWAIRSVLSAMFHSISPNSPVVCHSFSWLPLQWCTHDFCHVYSTAQGCAQSHRCVWQLWALLCQCLHSPISSAIVWLLYNQCDTRERRALHKTAYLPLCGGWMFSTVETFYAAFVFLVEVVKWNANKC